MKKLLALALTSLMLPVFIAGAQVSPGTGGLQRLSQDPSPTLGGDLDAVGYNITNVGDLEVTGDLTFTGVADSGIVIDYTDTEAFLVRKTSDTGDIFVINSDSGFVGINKTPTVELDVNGDGFFSNDVTADAFVGEQYEELIVSYPDSTGWWRIAQVFTGISFASRGEITIWWTEQGTGDVGTVTFLVSESSHDDQKLDMKVLSSSWDVSTMHIPNLRMLIDPSGSGVTYIEAYYEHVPPALNTRFFTYLRNSNFIDLLDTPTKTTSIPAGYNDYELSLDKSFSLRSQGDYSFFTVDKDGSVGIGTNSPSEKIEFDGGGTGNVYKMLLSNYAWLDIEQNGWLESPGVSANDGYMEIYDKYDTGQDKTFSWWADTFSPYYTAGINQSESARFEITSGDLSDTSPDFYMDTNGDVTIRNLTTEEQSSIVLGTIGTPTYSNVQDWHNTTQSVGLLDGGEVTDGGSGTIDIASLSAIIKTTNDPIGGNIFFDVAGVTGQVLTDNTTNWVYVDYNAGSPQLGVSLTNIANDTTIFNIAKVYREGTKVNIIKVGISVENQFKRAQQYVGERNGLHFVSGARVGETGTLNISITSGILYSSLNRTTTPAVDTSGTDTFEYYYYNGTAWIESDQSAIDSANYNDISTGLVPVAVARYGVHWIYKGTNGDSYVLYGQDSYTLPDAETAQPPESLPEHVEGFGVLRAKIIVAKDDTVFEEIQNVSDIPFSAQASSAHNDLTGLQGGAANEYYHFDATEFGFLDGQDQGVKTTDSPTFVGATLGGTTNNATFASDGSLTLNGTARYNTTKDFFAYNAASIAGTYNSISCNASGAGTLNGFYFKSFDDGGGVELAEAMNMEMELPENYVDGTDFTIEFSWTSATLTGDVRWQVGVAQVGVGDTFSPLTGDDNWATPQNLTAPTTVWERMSASFTVSGTNFVSGDNIRIVIFRDADNAADTMTGDAYITNSTLTYLSNQL